MGPVANPFLKDVMGKKELTMKGAADVQVDIKTTGDTVNQLKKNSLGEIILDMKKTEVNGFDPEFYMRSSIANYVDSKGFGLSKTIMGSYKRCYAGHGGYRLHECLSYRADVEGRKTYDDMDRHK